MDWGLVLTRTVDLGYDQMLMIESHPRSRVKVIYGGVWLTEAGDPQDVWLTSGEEVYLRTRGSALLQGLGASRVQLVEAPLTPRGRGRWMAGLRALVSRAIAPLQALRTRTHLGAAAAPCEAR